MDKDFVDKFAKLALSRNIEKHIRNQHYREFGYDNPDAFTRHNILRIAYKAIRNSLRVFTEKGRQTDYYIFESAEAMLIVSEEGRNIKTMFVPSLEGYVVRKLERKVWSEILSKGERDE